MREIDMDEVWKEGDLIRDEISYRLIKQRCYGIMTRIVYCMENPLRLIVKRSHFRDGDPKVVGHDDHSALMDSECSLMELDIS
jgi:hypothetical protein